jgi:hypothetical protein
MNFLSYRRYIHTFIHKHSVRPIYISSLLLAHSVGPPRNAESVFEPEPDLQQDGASSSGLQRTLIFHYYADVAKLFGSKSPLTSEHCHPMSMCFRFDDNLDGAVSILSCASRTCVIFHACVLHLHMYCNCSAVENIYLQCRIVIL